MKNIKAKITFDIILFLIWIWLLSIDIIKGYSLNISILGISMIIITFILDIANYINFKKL